MQISTIGLDIAKNVFQVHGVDAQGEIVMRRRLRRQQVIGFFKTLPGCVVGIEACATAHYWGRQLVALGHEVKLVPPAYVKAYVKRGKNDAVDAEAICEAVQRPSMRFVRIKTVEQQAVLVLHRVRAQLVRQRTRLANVLRAHMAEFGLIAPRSLHKLAELTAIIADEREDRLPRLARLGLRPVVEELEALKARITTLETEILAWHKGNETSRRLATIPGFGPIVASAVAASLPNPASFRSGRHFAAWLGLTPKDRSSGGKQRLGRISKMGDRYLRSLLVLGATSVLFRAKHGTQPGHIWMRKLLERRPPRLVTLAYANKMARIAWAIMMRGGVYQAPQITA